MSIEGLVFAFILVAIVALWIFTPFFGEKSKQKIEVEIQQKQHERLIVFYEQTLRNIRDLDDDHATGKISAKDYQREREEWTQRGVALLKALDSLNTQGIMTLDTYTLMSEDASVDDAIEAAVAAYRAQKE